MTIPLKLIALAIAILAARVGVAQSPASELRAAVENCATLPTDVHRGVRYITLYNVEPKQRELASRVVSYCLNVLSRNRAISSPRWLSSTLARFSIISYAPTATEYAEWAKAWEAISEIDPYFHIRTEATVNGKIITTTVDGGWTLPYSQKLKAMTQSNGGILRADWFIFHALQPPHYYDFAGIPDTEGEFLKTLGLDQKVVNALRANAGANIVISGVTKKPRRVIWSQGPLGGIYATLDVASVDAARDPRRYPIDADGATFTYDASEWFAMGPNGLWRNALYDAKGKKQNAVPANIATDTSEPYKPTAEIIPALDCIRCHTESGLRPFRDDQTRLTSKAPLGSYSPDVAVRAAEFYDEPRLQRQMKFDRETYEAACAKATGGLTPVELIEALKAVTRGYAYYPVTVETAARDCGVDVATFKMALLKSHDPNILSLIHDDEILRGQWEASFAESIVSVGAAQGIVEAKK